MSLGGRAWSWQGRRCFGHRVRGESVIPDVNSSVRSHSDRDATPVSAGCNVACGPVQGPWQPVALAETDLLSGDRSRGRRLSLDPMQLEASATLPVLPTNHTVAEWDPSSPDLGPLRSAQLWPASSLGSATIQGRCAKPRCLDLGEGLAFLSRPGSGNDGPDSPWEVMQLELARPILLPGVLGPPVELCPDSSASAGPVGVQDNQPGSPLGDVAGEIRSQICLPLQTPLIASKPRLRKARTPRSIGSLRRSARIAAKPRAANCTVQAQGLLMQKLGVIVDPRAAGSYG